MEVLKHDSAFDDGDLKDLGDDTIVVTSEQAAQFSSIINIGAMVGALIAGVACDVLGRRSTILLVAPIFAGMWIWTATTTSYAQLIVARVTTGVAVGVVSMATPLYISETAPTNLRGSLGSVNQVSEVVVHPIIVFQHV
jgi:SP family sugar:H+ symporter-like MFS transporter